MLVRIDLRQITFGQPEILWLLAAPALLLVLWAVIRGPIMVAAEEPRG